MRATVRSAFAAMAVLLCQLGAPRAEVAPKPAARTDGPVITPESINRALLKQGIDAVKAGHPADAIVIFEKIDAYYSGTSSSGQKPYCSHSAPESLIYLTKSAAEHVSSRIVPSVWCDAIYFKAYSLIELNRMEEASAALDHALELAPDNPQYLNEKGELLTRARRWNEAKTVFNQAEKDHVYSSSPADGVALASRACRGLGFVLTEEKKLDEAEANYHRCLGLDANDEKSKNELRYIQQLRQKILK